MWLVLSSSEKTNSELSKFWQLTDTCTVECRSSCPTRNFTHKPDWNVPSVLQAGINHPCVCIFQSVIFHIITVLMSATLFRSAGLRWRGLGIKYLFTVSHTKVEQSFGAESSEIIAPIAHPPGCMPRARAVFWAHTCAALCALDTNAIRLNRLCITGILLCHTGLHQLFP